MDQILSTELRYLYMSDREHPRVIRIRIRMRDLISLPALRNAVDAAMKRYPYFCVELKKKDGAYLFAPNDRPVVISGKESGIRLNAPETNFHLLAFSWHDNWIVMDVFHGLTDGIGAYEAVRTLLYYYCSERYDITLKEEGIRVSGEPVPMEEWENPVDKLTLPAEAEASFPQGELKPALNLLREGVPSGDNVPTVYSVTVSESEFMRFNMDHDGSPGTMVSLFLSRAIAALHPACNDPVRISLCADLRHVLGAPSAHQSLVGTIRLEYKDAMRDWPLDKQATAFRGMVILQTQEERLLSGAAAQKRLTERFLQEASDEERKKIAEAVKEKTKDAQTATVSYVGKANYREAERYIRDFRTWAQATVPLMIEISAVNGTFTLDFIQSFSDPVYVNAFLAELEQQAITYDLQDVMPLALPSMKLPWEEEPGGTGE